VNVFWYVLTPAFPMSRRIVTTSWVAAMAPPILEPAQPPEDPPEPTDADVGEEAPYHMTTDIGEQFAEGDET